MRALPNPWDSEYLIPGLAILPMDHGEILTRWTVRIAVVLYVIGLASRGYSPKWSRVAWTGGCAAYLLLDTIKT